MRIPRTVKEVGARFIQNGYHCYLVGGAIRNMVAHLPVTDYDLATDAKPEQVMRLFKRVIPTGIKHGTVTVLYKSSQFEVTTFRVEGEYSDSRRPDSIAYTPSIYEDLKRRDFTINSLALNLKNDELIDPHDGRKDLGRKIIRAIGDPNERFSEDALRMLRACRFAAELNFSIDKPTHNGIKRNCKKIKKVSSERIRDELIKMLLSEQPSEGIEIMEQTGLLSLILPELQACKGVEQKGFHRYDVYYHLLAACDMSEPILEIRLAALLHDIGKPNSLDYDESGVRTFYRHEEYSEQLAGEILHRLRFPKKVEQEVRLLIMHHMFSYSSDWSDSAVRRLISRVGKANLENLFKLRRADQRGITGSSRRDPRLEELAERIDDILARETAFTVTDLAVNGNDLHEEAGVPRGPEMGTVLRFLLETVLDDPSLNKKDKLLPIAENFYRKRVQDPT